MITNAFINLLFGIVWLLTSPIRLLSDVTLNSNFTSALYTAGGYYHSLNTILPVDTMIVIFSISLVIELGYLIWKAINWGIKKIPMIS